MYAPICTRLALSRYDKELARCTGYQVFCPQRPQNPHRPSPPYGRPPVSRQAARKRPKTAAPPAQPKPSRAEDRERIALGLNDVVVRRLLTAGQDLQAALELMGNHPASGKVRHAVDEMDQAIRDIRDTILDHPAGERPPSTHPRAQPESGKPYQPAW